MTIFRYKTKQWLKKDPNGKLPKNKANQALYPLALVATQKNRLKAAYWSGQTDSNHRHLAPKASALPG